jgi:Ca-activated chloride channel family protein
MQQGQPGAAAATFADPRRKAYASMQAGDYAGAAGALAPLNDSEAHYNRGNALAHAGDLPGALAAYDAALKLDPQHHDARHNRDLVAKALDEQKKQQDKQNQQDQKNREDKKDGQKPQQSQPGADPQKKDGKDGKPDAKPDGPQANPKNGDGSKLPPPKPDQESGKGQSSNEADNARRDAKASMAPEQPGQAEAAKPGPGGEATGKANAATTPLNEKQLALDQWLRSIPDDPGGLLRRKFLIEHLMRQREARP